MTSRDLLKVSRDHQTLVIHQGKVYDVTKFVNVHPGMIINYKNTSLVE